MTPAERTQRTKALIEDVVFMLSTGEHPDMICTRLRTSGAALSKLLRRHDRGDIAAAFDVVCRRDRKAQEVRAIERRSAPDPIDMTAARDARIGDWRADLDRQITRDPSTGAWTTRADVRQSRRTA